MLEERDWRKLEALFKNGLIEKRNYNLIMEADDPEQAEAIIVKLLAEKVALIKYEESELPELTRIIAESVRAQFSPSLGKRKTVSIGELLEFLENLLNMITESNEQEVSIILCPCAWEMIGEFYGPPKTLLSEKFITIAPRIKNIFVKKNAEIPENVLNYLANLPDVKVISDPQHFIKEAENTIVICRCIGSAEPELIELICCLLAKGIFLIADQEIDLNLTDLIAFKQAIDKGPAETNQGVICLEKELFRKPFDPSVTIAVKGSRLDGESGAKIKNEEDTPKEAVRAIMARIFPGFRIDRQ